MSTFYDKDVSNITLIYDKFFDKFPNNIKF